MTQMARKRHMRYTAFDRTARSARLRAFLAERAEALENTGSTVTFTATGVPVPEVPAVASSGTLSAVTIAANNTVTIGATVYTFVAAFTDNNGEPVPYQVAVGQTLAATLANLIAAINGGAGEGTAYSESTPAHANVTAAAGQAGQVVVTARVAGEDGDLIATLATLTSGSWGNATLQGGVDFEAYVPSTGIFGATSHGLSVGEGPFLLSSTDDLPAWLAEDTFYWVGSAPTEHTFTLTTRRSNVARALYGDTGSGTLTMVKADSDPAILEYLRQNAPEVVRDADDVDDL